MKKIHFLIFPLILFGAVSCDREPVYKDPSAPLESRVKDLLRRMTLEEKLRQIDIWHPKMDLGKSEELNKAIAALGDTVRNGIGFLQFEVRMNQEDYAARFNAIQKYFVEQTRLGIPAISNAEGCHGFVGNEDKPTVFPSPPLLGSTWNPDLIETVYTAIAREMRSYGVTHAATPVIDLLRDPRFGRADEFLGEDPYHVATMGVAAILGLQGRSPLIDEYHLLACAKHFSGHGQPEGGTNIGPSNLSERILRENHFYPFEMAVKKGNVRTVMASYNEIDGVPNHANKWLLTDVLRGEWGFTGYVISDYDAVNRMITKYHSSKDKPEAAMRSINAGMDFECPSNWKNYCFSYLPELIAAGKVKESVLDSAVVRVLRNKFILGLFEHPYIKEINDSDKLVMQKKHREIALKAAEQGMILLTNKNKTLPFNENKIKRLAVIGPNADEVHYGNYSNDISPGISILEGMRNYGKGKFGVFYSEGFKIYENDNSIPQSQKTREAEDRRIAEAVKLAKTCDAVLLVMGGNELTCREEWSNHTGDYYDLDLLGRQEDLARAIFALGKKTAVILINGRPQSVNYLAENAPAMIEGWYLGQDQGTAVARVVFGKVNPSGKLAVSFPRHVGQLPVYYNGKPYMHEAEYIDGKYSPLYPFGFGLSYTHYDYTNLRLSDKTINIGDTVKVAVDITNSGEMDGDEIVQLYIKDIVSTVTRPVKELKDFSRVSLKKGETRTVEFTITSEKLQYYGPDMKRLVEPGEFEVQAGRNSMDYISDKFEIKTPLK
jgi:beta-glucosidase